MWTSPLFVERLQQQPLLCHVYALNGNEVFHIGIVVVDIRLGEDLSFPKLHKASMNIYNINDRV